MSKWVSARFVSLAKGEFTEIEDDERVAAIEYSPPVFYLTIVKETYRNPNYDD